MSLNSERMLPGRVRKMKQMKELLQAENNIVTEIELAINDMYQRSGLLHEDLVNEIWLVSKLEEMTGGTAYVSKVENLLHIEIILQIDQLTGKKESELTAFINRWLPAHLAYHIVHETYLESCACFTSLWQDDEIMTLRQVDI